VAQAAPDLGVAVLADDEQAAQGGGEMIGCCVFGIAAAIRFADGFSGGFIFLNPIC